MRNPFLALTLVLLPFAVQGGEARQQAAGPQVGKPAPTFRLNDHTGAAVAVGGKAKTWTVVAFYPKAATPG